MPEAAAPTAPVAGRRERNMADKQRRIFAAVSALFDERGFDAVTTQEIADRADVAGGTVFRYAASKPELLLMVYNERFREAIESGTRAAARLDDPSDPVAVVIALVDPIIEFAAGHPQNSLLYQRELLFGAPTQPYRIEGVALVVEFEATIARLLAEAARRRRSHLELPERDAERAARSVFAALSLLLAQPATGVRWGGNGVDELHAQISQIVLGYLVSTGTDVAGPGKESSR